MKLDHSYLIVSNLQKSIEIYSALLGRLPDYIEKDEWADWNKDGVYFGLMSKDRWKGSGNTINNGRSPVIVFSSNNLNKDAAKVKEIGLEITTPIEKAAGSTCNYTFFDFTDPDGHIIEVANYNRI